MPPPPGMTFVITEAWLQKYTMKDQVRYRPRAHPEYVIPLIGLGLRLLLLRC